MRLCIIGIGGCEDIWRSGSSKTRTWRRSRSPWGEHVSFGGVKGLGWRRTSRRRRTRASSAPWRSGCYPGFFIPHDVIGFKSKTSKLIVDKYENTCQETRVHEAG